VARDQPHGSSGRVFCTAPGYAVELAATEPSPASKTSTAGMTSQRSTVHRAVIVPARMASHPLSDRAPGYNAQ